MSCRPKRAQFTSAAAVYAIVRCTRMRVTAVISFPKKQLLKYPRVIWLLGDDPNAACLGRCHRVENLDL